MNATTIALDVLSGTSIVCTTFFLPLVVPTISCDPGSTSTLPYSVEAIFVPSMRTSASGGDTVIWSDGTFAAMFRVCSFAAASYSSSLASVAADCAFRNHAIEVAYLPRVS